MLGTRQRIVVIMSGPPAAFTREPSWLIRLGDGGVLEDTPRVVRIDPGDVDAEAETVRMPRAPEGARGRTGSGQFAVTFDQRANPERGPTNE